jgi:hypothetical protein
MTSNYNHPDFFSGAANITAMSHGTHQENTFSNRNNKLLKIK